MKEIRIIFTPEEYNRLDDEAVSLGVTVKKLIHTRAVGIGLEGSSIYAARELSNEISQYRESLNRIIKRETTAEIRLYEDDIIMMEQIMVHIEEMVALYIAHAIKEA